VSELLAAQDPLDEPSVTRKNLHLRRRFLLVTQNYRFFAAFRFFATFFAAFFTVFRFFAAMVM
jgi:hypothetical protein